MLGARSSTNSGKRVTPEGALGIAAVYTAVRILSESLAGLPFKLFERLDGKGKREASTHPLYDLVHEQPGPETTSEGLRISLMGNALLRGNGFAQKVVDGAGRVRELIPIMAKDVTIERPSPTSLLEYRVTDDAFGAVGRTIPRHRMWHFPAWSWDGICGMSVVEMARESLGVALAAEHHYAGSLRNGARLSGFLEYPGKLKPDARKNLQESFDEQYAGPDKAGKVGVLEEGVRFNKVGMTPQDLNFFQGRDFDIFEVARWFRLPAHMLAANLQQPRANMEQQGLEFVIFSLGPWVVRLEQTGRRDLLHPGERAKHFLELNVAGLLRGDLKTRYAAFAQGRQWGWLNVNEIRALENLDPTPDGNEYLRPINMEPVDEPRADPSPRDPAAGDEDPEADPADPMARRGLRMDFAPPGPSARELALLEDAARRMVTRESRAIAKAATKCESPEAFEAWAGDYYAEHVAFVRGALHVSEGWAETYCRTRRERAVAAVRGGAPIEDTTKAWEAALPAEIVQEVQRA